MSTAGSKSTRRRRALEERVLWPVSAETRSVLRDDARRLPWPEDYSHVETRSVVSSTLRSGAGFDIDPTRHYTKRGAMPDDAYWSKADDAIDKEFNGVFVR